ncbi:MAG: hypothetical protein R3A52_21240 [Polyangiales bacterium]
MTSPALPDARATRAAAEATRYADYVGGQPCFVYSLARRTLTPGSP